MGADRSYHDYADLPCMVLLSSTLQRAEHTMKNTMLRNFFKILEKIAD
jgi:gluconate kinase